MSEQQMLVVDYMVNKDGALQSEEHKLFAVGDEGAASSRYREHLAIWRARSLNPRESINIHEVYQPIKEPDTLRAALILTYSDYGLAGGMTTKYHVTIVLRRVTVNWP